MDKLDVRFEEHEQYLEAVVGGTYDLQEAVHWFQAVLAGCKRSALTNVLIDYRELSGAPAATQDVLYAFGVVDLYATYRSSGGQPLRLAYLGAREKINTYQPGLEAARGTGLEVKVFTDAAEAREWLGV